MPVGVTAARLTGRTRVFGYRRPDDGNTVTSSRAQATACRSTSFTAGSPEVGVRNFCVGSLMATSAIVATPAVATSGDQEFVPETDLPRRNRDSLSSAAASGAHRAGTVDLPVIHNGASQ